MITTSSSKLQVNNLVSGFLCLLIAFGGFVFGWDTGTISGFVNMPDYIERFGQKDSVTNLPYLSDFRTGLLVGIFNIGCAVGGVAIGKITDTTGRRKSLMVTMALYIVGVLIQITSSRIWIQYLVGRIVTGLAVGGTSVVSPMFISETSPSSIRGTLVSCYQLMITAGIFLGYCTTYATHRRTGSSSWRLPMALCFIWALLMAIGMSFMPESPRFLIEKGHMVEARRSIAKVNNLPLDSEQVDHEMTVLSVSIEAEQAAGSASWNELVIGQPKIFYRVVMGILLQSLQQLTGCNYFFYYGTTVFKSVGIDDSFKTSILLGAVNFGATFLALYIVDHFGRRKTLLGGCAGMSSCLLAFSIIGVKALYKGAYGASPVNKAAGDAMSTVTCIYIAFFATTWAPTVFVVVSETYPLRIRTKAMGLATSSNWLWGFFIAFFTPAITRAIHFAYGFVFFGCVVFAAVFVYTCVPETKGLSLEDVDFLYTDFVPGLAFAKTDHKPESESP